MKPYASSEALFTWEDFENLIRTHDGEIKRRAAAIRAGDLAHDKLHKIWVVRTKNSEGNLRRQATTISGAGA